MSSTMRKTFRRIAAVAVATAAVWGGTAGAASAQDVPIWGLYGYTINSVGDNNFCTMNVDVRLETKPGTGHVLAHYTPKGFGGPSPCGVWVHANFYNTAFPFLQDVPTYVSSTTGPVTVDLPTGLGLNSFALSTWPLLNKDVGGYIWVP